MTSRFSAIALLAAALTTSPVSLGQGAQAPLPSVSERLFRHLEQAVYIAPGKGLGRVTIGTPIAAVPRLWGTPQRSDRSGIFKRRTTYVYKTGIDAWIVIKGDSRVEEIGVQGRSGFETTEGVRFGMPRHQVSLIYGHPDETGEDGRYLYRDRGIGFVFKSGMVFQINVFEPGADAG